MSLALDEWQARLETHFADLASARVFTGYPLFALEHGLSEAELSELSALLRARVRHGGHRLSTHWLGWVAYATEFGYGYDGDQYWDSFESETPGWRQYGSRELLKNWFRRFRKDYNGISPTGRWARHFSIISLPITHAILPSYLQQQFAQLLYSLRYTLARSNTSDAASLGKILANSAWNASTRFEQFLQQEALAGQIAIALLQGGESREGPIYRPTLDKIVKDLEKVRQSREWLKDVRRFVLDRMVGTGRATNLFSSQQLVRSLQSFAGGQPTSVKPSLLLRRTDAKTWAPIMEFPSFAGVAKLNSEFSAFLKTTRCRISGLPDTWLPPAWLLSARQRRVLKNWPDASRLAIEFEKPNPALQNLLVSECRIPKAPFWLFKLARDGIARSIEGMMVRPGLSYVFVSQEPVTVPPDIGTPVDLTCPDMHAQFLDIPATLSAAQIQSLSSFGLQVCRTIRITPAGLSARNWDGEGNSEWLTTEAPCFSIVHDHPVDKYNIYLNHNLCHSIEGGRAGVPHFLSLPPLTPGKHRLTVRAERVGTFSSAAALAFTRDTEGTIALVVRDPLPWVPGTTLHSGLTVFTDPTDPSLDSIWEGDCDLSVLGPDNRQVTCSISLKDKDGGTLLDHVVGTLELPVSPNDWHRRWDQSNRDEARAWKYLEARSAILKIDGEELGQYRLPLERETKPVRWVCRAGGHGTSARFFDDTGLEGEAELTFFSFGQPLIGTACDPEKVVEGFELSGQGGLLVAKHGEHMDCVVGSSKNVAGGLQGLLIEPSTFTVDWPGVPDVLRRLKYWSEARLAGPLAANRRAYVLRKTTEHFFGNFLGPRWEAAEHAFASDADSSQKLKTLREAIGGNTSFGFLLGEQISKFTSSDKPNVTAFFQLAARYGITADKELCEFALRFASAPWVAMEKYGDRFSPLAQSTGQPLLRAARMLSVFAMTHDQVRTYSFAPRWTW
ncbi:hypothetical protein [Bradyrhizobium sp. G127]|uniref:hypothetical protein n=1 Tax=Bradyrhizobium sp. G127 TaxID=2904800 RepID=UPI001F384061|nr:hypothetical protein [Bradyrhizobium sp. G127]MCF2525398.1 hypothetical protein [Bradyrhizobium sp. G127]